MVKSIRQKTEQIRTILEAKQAELQTKTIALGEFRSQEVIAPALLIYCVPDSSETHAGAQQYITHARVTILAIPDPQAAQSSAMIEAIELLERAEKVLIEANISLAKQPQMIPFFSERHSDACALASQFLTPYCKHYEQQA